MSRPAPLTDAEVDALIAAGHDVLRVFPNTAGACVMMSALYVGKLHHLGHRDAQLIGGTLAIGDAIVFGRSGVSTNFALSNLDWDGHAWILFGEYLADVSLVMTAYSDNAPKRVAEHVRTLRKPNQRLYIATPDAASREDRLTYTPQHRFTDDEITSLYRGALTFLQ